MPSKINPAVKERAMRMVADHRGDYPSDTALAEAVASRSCRRKTVRRWIIQADIDAGTRAGASTDERPRSNALKAENKRLREDNGSCVRPRFSSPGSSTPATADRGVHRRHGSRGHAVEPVCRVLSEQGCQVAARTYRAWRRVNRPVAAARSATPT